MNGLSGAGKSMWVQTLLKKKYFTQPAEMVYLCLPKNQSHLFKEQNWFTELTQHEKTLVNDMKQMQLDIGLQKPLKP